MKKILLVEDDLSLGFLLVDFLESEGFAVKLCRDGEAGWRAFQQGQFDVCLIDVMLPKMDGFMLSQKIRTLNPTIPFLFLTARSLKKDKLKGFNLGAEDYITKPFDEEVLLCKIKVIIRRQEDNKPVETLPTQFKIGRYLFDYQKQALTIDNETKRITEKENEVLRLLCLHKNQILKRQDALQKIYGKYDYFLGRSFDVFISRLRKLLQHDPNVCIENVFKVGFILRDEVG